MATRLQPFLRSTLAWLPLAGIVLVLIGPALSGHAGVLPHAAAASTIEVTGLVEELVYLDAAGCTEPTARTIGDLIPNDPWKATTDDCTVVFGTSNSLLGADLTVREDPTSPGAADDAMRCIEASCNAAGYDGAINDVSVDAPVPAAGTSAFGAVLRAASGAASPVWTLERANPVADASTACRTPGVGDGTCSFRFGATSGADDGPGSYRAQAEFLVLAR